MLFKLYRKNDELNETMKPWSIDMFSMGAILLEIFTGFPLWLSMKGRMDVTDDIYVLQVGNLI